ncbi:carboxypeptidase-like regulatory domain-containing protein [Aureliella helgolandensis]|uniref:Nickel uptake substrate-specific transmembrane region n=1 Tax=Aureliella helgolandensis TaxID=2527968 RepID=A0A518GBF5_9BACT|nr:carboxypeptidase-like regulatory domain-containing protein [Aureliella helgolandensis]QDV25942.1 Nickel uptake substrate-specific transmembrane region [Aureliella helgolandensis]
MPDLALSKVWSARLALACLMTAFCSCTALGQGNVLNVIQGTVSNEKGEPIPNARVDISTAAPISGPAIFCPSCYLDCQKWTTTNEAGQFKIADLDPRLEFRIVVSAAGYKTAQTELIAPRGTNHDLTLRERPATVDPQRVVSGTVENETGIPIQGALVTPANTIDKQGLRSSSSKGGGPAITDVNGYFEIDLVDGVFGVDVEISAEGLSSRRFIDLNSDSDRKSFELLEGAHITGRVTSNGQAVQGMTVFVAQIDHSYKGEKLFRTAVPMTADTEGRFEFKNLFAEQEYCVYTVVGEGDRSDSDEIIMTQKFVTPPNGRTLHIGDLTTVAPVSLSGRLETSDQQSLGDLVLSLGRAPAWDLIRVPVSSDGSFRIEGLPPEVYEIRIASNRFDLDAGKIDTLLWTEKSIKLFIEKSIDDFVLPITAIENGSGDTQQNGTQVLNGRVTLSRGKDASGIIVSANDGNSPKTTTSDAGSFTLEFPAGTDWIKLYKPDPDGMRFWYLGRFKPKFVDNDVNIQLGPETTYEPDMLSVKH